MLAEEYGYQVSPRPAADTVGVRAQVEEFRKSAQRRVLWLALGSLVFLGVFYAIFRDDPVIVLIPLTAMVLGLSAGYRSACVKAPRKLLDLLEASHWQVWPCRLEEIEGKAVHRRVVLLAPDKSVAASFVAVVPHSVWLGMTDGRGVLWIAGDLRFQGVAAVPGGRPLWVIEPEKPAQRSAAPAAGGAGGSGFDELVSEARSAVVWNMLN